MSETQDVHYVEINRQMIQVIDFNRRILGISKRRPAMQDEDEFKLSLKQLREEIDELEEAYNNNDFIGTLDALIDLEYFLLGIFWKNGIDEKTHCKLFNAVHSANMMKKMGVKAGREGFRAADAVKPSDWTDPQLMFARILEEHSDE